MGPRTIAPGVLALATGVLFACTRDSPVSPSDHLTLATNRGTGGASVEYQYFAGTPFSQELPDTAEAANGERIEIKGTGFFALHPKSVNGGGTFVHKDPDGNIVAMGNWTAVQLLSFQSYGPSPVLDPTFEAGKAVLRVHLAPSAGGAGVDAVLAIGCILPGGEDDDPGAAFEGSRLAVQRAPSFNRIVPFSPTLFVRQ